MRAVETPPCHASRVTSHGFVMRYLPHTNDDINQMLSTIGTADVEELFASIPKAMRCNPELDLPSGMSEMELGRHLSRLAQRNTTLDEAASFLGAGTYRHYVPAAVSELASRSEFVTPYTPYQPEVSQGTLQAMFEYQSQICRLFGMDVSNASHYSGPTALADAALLARRVGRKRTKIVIPENIHPDYRHVVQTVLAGDDDIRTVRQAEGRIDRAHLEEALDEETAAVCVAFPNFFGVVEDLRDIATLAHDAGALLIAVVPEPLALGILSPPGDWGADIAVGEGIGLGLPTSFGGPTLGIFTVTKALMRQMPGRVSGRTIDAEGRRSYTLTLATREQHIRREKATSNICSNQALCATTAAINLSLLGKEGIRELAIINASKAAALCRMLTAIPNVEQAFFTPFFNEFVLETPKPAAEVLKALADDGIFGGVDLGRFIPGRENALLVCATEMNTKEEMERYAEKLGEIVRS